MEGVVGFCVNVSVFVGVCLQGVLHFVTRGILAMMADIVVSKKTLRHVYLLSS